MNNYRALGKQADIELDEAFHAFEGILYTGRACAACHAPNSDCTNPEPGLLIHHVL